MISSRLFLKSALAKSQFRRFAIVSRFTKDHEWVKYDTETKLAKVGITDYAQQQLGDIVFLDLPKQDDPT